LGYIIDIIGFFPDGSVNGHTWTNVTHPGTWSQETNGASDWFSQLLPGTSTVTGTTETFSLHYFLSGDIWPLLRQGSLGTEKECTILH